MPQSATPITVGSPSQSHAFDAQAHPEYFDGVLSRRVMAFLIDIAIIFTLWIAAVVILFFVGIFTLGLAWLLYGALFPIVALGYNAWTLSRDVSATVGMRFMDLEMRTWYGERMYALLAAFHALLYYFTVTMLTPFILLIAPFNARKRCLHDFFAGTVVINSKIRADSLL
ncbi:MAG: RDD family protein [Hyphomicrobiales bacterium]|nr:RDD family protein [Hyphomicrobiales bacterium]